LHVNTGKYFASIKTQIEAIKFKYIFHDVIAIVSHDSRNQITMSKIKVYVYNLPLP